MIGRVSGNVWIHLDADGGIHTVTVDESNDMVMVDAQRFSKAQALEFATTVVMFAAGIEAPVDGSAP